MWATLALPLVFVAGCIGGLDSPTRVVTPRILAIVADPPEAAPGDDIRVRVMAFDPMERALTYRWTACIGVAQIAAATGLGSTRVTDETCIPIPGSDRFETVVPGAVTAGILENLPVIAAGAGFPEEALLGILATAGLSFQVHVDVLGPEGEVLVSGYKRVAVTTRASPTTNPPPIEYLVADVRVHMPPDPFATPFECLVAGRIEIPAGERVIFAAQDDPDEWIETFPIFDYTGGIREGTENAYYSFYATAGDLSAETTRPPDRDVFYRAPLEPGPVRVFFVLRDGHLGTRACAFDLEVTEPFPAP